MYGTLVDLAQVGDEAGDGRAIREVVRRWRTHQLEISWLLTVMERYEDFEAVTAYALDVALSQSRVRLSRHERDALLRDFDAVPAFSEVGSALDRLRDAGFRLAVLSNGSAPMLESLLRKAGLRDRFEVVVSADEVGAYKPAPAVYHHAARRLKRSIAEVWLVSANAFDAAGAKAAGMKVAKVERQPSFRYPFAEPPDLTVASLEELTTRLEFDETRGSFSAADET